MLPLSPWLPVRLLPAFSQPSPSPLSGFSWNSDSFRPLASHSPSPIFSWLPPPPASHRSQLSPSSLPPFWQPSPRKLLNFSQLGFITFSVLLQLSPQPSANLFWPRSQPFPKLSPRLYQNPSSRFPTICRQSRSILQISSPPAPSHLHQKLNGNSLQPSPIVLPSCSQPSPASPQPLPVLSLLLLFT